MTDSQLLNATRVSVIIVTVFSIILAFLKSNIYELVGEASAFTLVSLFVPLVGGMFFRINEKAAIASMFSGIAGWATVYLSSIEFPAVLAGLFCSFTSAVLFSLKSKTVNG
jgi:solute:Na+ symporter, SSS family